MFLSVFELFKVGIGPSSSHTMGPMTAAGRFLDELRARSLRPAGLKARLYGSLAYTGKGHATDRAVILGLAGFLPDNVELAQAEAALTANRDSLHLAPGGLGEMAFDPAADLVFDYGPRLPGHPNGMILQAVAEDGAMLFEETYYSIGGGFVLTAAELAASKAEGATPHEPANVPYPFATGDEMLAMARSSGLSIAQMKRVNEEVLRSDAEIDRQVGRIWQVMRDCMERGLATGGELPGGLRIKRRAPAIYAALQREQGTNIGPPHLINDWLLAYAMAVNEENAAGGQVVTAPTNGAAGVVPAVLRYWLDHVPDADPSRLDEFMLTASAIGGLVKHKASISGAEGGCQAEVGSASAMAAAGLCAVLGGSPEQVANAAEIALEHHLGLTCDPVKGLVQVPCIERNGIGAIKAVSSASLALRGDGTHFVSLDAVIATLRQTGDDMSEKYKETSLGGLAVNVPNC